MCVPLYLGRPEGQDSLRNQAWAACQLAHLGCDQHWEVCCQEDEAAQAKGEAEGGGLQAGKEAEGRMPHIRVET